MACFRGESTWTPVARIVDALDAAYYQSFGNVEPTGKRLLTLGDSVVGHFHKAHGMNVDANDNAYYDADNARLEMLNFVISGEARRSADDTWEQPWGERRFVRDRYNELRVRLSETTAAKRSLRLSKCRRR